MELINEGFDHPLNRVFFIKAIHKKASVCRPNKLFCVGFSLLGQQCSFLQNTTGADPGVLEWGFICMKTWGYALLISSLFS